MSNPWSSAAERLNRYVSLDRALAEKLAELSRKQSRDTALATALEEGRSFGVRRMHAQMLQQRSLNKDLRADPPTTKSY